MVSKLDARGTIFFHAFIIMAGLRQILMGRNGDYFLNYIDYSKNGLLRQKNIYSDKDLREIFPVKIPYATPAGPGLALEFSTYVYPVSLARNPLYSVMYL